MNTNTKKRNFIIALITSIIVLNFGFLNVNANTLSKTIKISYIDVGQADSILIQSYNSTMLIDAGNRDDDKTVIDYLKKQGVKKLNYVIGTHPHEDHIGGMSSVLNAFKVDKIIMPKVTANTATFRKLITTIKDKGLKITTPIAESSFKLDDANCKILAPNSSSYEDVNNYSVVIKLSYGKTSFMFDGDAEDVSENEMISKGYDLKADVLKLGHHGSHSSSTDAFLDKVNPKYAIISCGKGNDYGHPHDVTIAKLLKRNITFYRTDVNGTIVATTDGNNITFTTTGSSKPNNNITPDSPNGVVVPGVNSINKSSTQSGSVVNKGNTTNNSNYSNGDIIVYITKSGKDYHSENCKSLKNSKIPIILSEAVKRGYKSHLEDGAPILK